MLFNRKGCKSAAQPPRAAAYILKKADFPVIGSGGASGGFSTAFSGGAEQAEKMAAVRTTGNPKRSFIIRFVTSSLQCTALK
jgi:hypothetical protein